MEPRQLNPQSETMQKSSLLLVLAIPFVLLASFIIAGSTIRNSAAAEVAAPSEVRWEFNLYTGNGTGSMSALNDLGKDGWELVSTVCDTSAGANGQVRHYLKRKLP